MKQGINWEEVLKGVTIAAGVFFALMLLVSHDGPRPEDQEQTVWFYLFGGLGAICTAFVAFCVYGADKQIRQEEMKKGGK